jgi:uncharacterized repeat protein (TIGR01451 family)
MWLDDSPLVRRRAARPWFALLVTALLSVVTLLALLSLLASQSAARHRTEAPGSPSVAGPTSRLAPIPPPEGYPKLALSTKNVTPTLAGTGGAILFYSIEIRNTGATTATNTTLVDELPEHVTYNEDAWASQGQQPNFDGDTLSWMGDVGFDSTVVITFSVTVDNAFVGTVRNSAVIDDPGIARPVTVTAETAVTDDPILGVEKSSLPDKPGPNKQLVYELQVTNWGQPAVSLPIMVTDRVPENTAFRDVDPYGVTNAARDVVTWTRSVDLGLGESTFFTFSVDVADVQSGTVIANTDYAVTPYSAGPGELYTVTVVDPILTLAKHVWPDPPGSNREMTYTLTLLNQGSMATGISVTDNVPDGVSYVRGGTEDSGVVSWDLDELDTGESAEFTFTVYVSDVMNVPIVNSGYAACCDESACGTGDVVTSVVEGPIFEAYAIVDPIAHKPGGGTGTEVTPTLVIHNVGAGSAIDAKATLYFDRLSVSATDLSVDPPISTVPGFPDGPDCGNKCKSYYWVGPIGHGEVVTFTTHEGQSTIGGEEGTHYTATVVVTDALSNLTTYPVSATAIGTVTHMANVQPIKSAPPVIGAGGLLTYVIEAYNRGLTTLLPPILTDVVPMSTTFVWASDSGTSLNVSDTTIVSWTLPLLSPGEGAVRSFSVRVDDDLVSGTQVVNREYSVSGYGNMLTGTVTTGPPVTTTVREVGLIDSFKLVTPQLALPGPGIVLTFEVHLVNSSPNTLRRVKAFDLLPWADSTYQRDAAVSAGQLVSDIISINWQGDIGPFSEEVLTATVLVDAGFQGPLTNTVEISHPDLLAPVKRHAVAYVTDQPVLFIYKVASPDPVPVGERLKYELYINNRGQQATGLVITDVLPGNVTFVPDSATAGGQLVDGVMTWEWPVLEAMDELKVTFAVTADQGTKVVNAHYAVRCAEGVSAVGPEVITRIKGGTVYLPLVLRGAP